MWWPKSKTLVLLVLLSLLLGIGFSNQFEPVLQRPAWKITAFLKTGSFQNHRFEGAIPKMKFDGYDQFLINPFYVGVYAMRNYDLSKEANENAYFLDYYLLEHYAGDDPYQDFLTQARWFIDNGEEREVGGVTFVVWPYPFDYDYGQLKSGWVSALAQSMVIQVLLRAYQETGESHFKEYAELALNSFRVEVKDGGVTLKEGEDSWWYEEYCSLAGEDSYVLNGMLHVLIALDEYFEATGYKLAKELFINGMNSLELNMERYDYEGWWTYYDRIGTPSNYKYQKINFSLTRHLNSITDDKYSFLGYDRIWERYNKHFFLREFIKQRPDKFEILLLLMSVSGVFLINILLALFAANFAKRRF